MFGVKNCAVWKNRKLGLCLDKISKCAPSSTHSFLKFSKRDFFLKYLERKMNLDTAPNKNKDATGVKKIESIDLKELLNEKNIKISIFDILHDYRNFRREYYSINKEKVEQENVKLPFERKDTNLKNIIHYFFFSDKFSITGKIIFYLLLINCFFFIIHWRKERAEKINIDIFSKMAPNKKEDEEEIRKHSAKKWNKLD